LTLITLDPALGAEHLTGWARSAVAVVTAGRASSTRIHAVGEMIQLAGTPDHIKRARLADATGESLGVIPAPRAARDFAPREGFTF
jgi:hypothetical protein